PEVEVNIDLNINSYIPSDYIGSSDDKVEIYKKIAEIDDKDKYYDIIDELVDRFGDLPEPVLNIIKISLIKNEAKKLGLINISGDKRRIKFEYESRDTYSLEDIQVLSSKFEENLEFDLSK